MKRLFNPYWILVTFTVPQLIIFFLYYGTYKVIHSLLSSENMSYWIQYGIIIGILCVLSTGYAIFCVIKRVKVSYLFGFAVFLTYLPFLYVFIIHSDKAIPWSIPRWMLFEGDLTLYLYTFLMPVFVYAMLLLLVHYTPKEKEHKLWRNFFQAAAIPCFWYLLVNVMQVWKYSSGYFITVFTLVGSIIFLFFTARFVYILALQYQSIWNQYSLVWKIPITIIAPLIGLWLNGEYSPLASHIFGDFSDNIFYYLALVNGIFLCIPPIHHTTFRLFLFFARTLTFPYIIYFFLVFLPFLPLSFLAILVFGTGLLMLAPLAVFIIQWHTLSEDYQYIRHHQGKIMSLAVFFLALLILPLFLVSDYWQDRQTLHQALNQVYEPNYWENASQKINVKALQRTLQHIKDNKDRTPTRGDFGIGTKGHKPYLSAFYKWLVLDNLTLSDKKIYLLENIFLGHSSYKISNNVGWLPPVVNDSVRIDSLYTQSTYHPEEKYWTTWLHFHIQNQMESRQEYNTLFQLPQNAWISNYYLDIEGKREYGLLAEKKAATWVYQQIVSTRRDPGILHYTQGNQIAFKVFPMEAKQVRTTGVEFIHKTPLLFTIDNQKIWLGDTSKISLTEKPVELETIAYIPASFKKTLSKIERKPLYHFIVDTSLEGKKAMKSYVQQIQAFLKKKRIDLKNVRITLANYRTHTISLKENWAEILLQAKGEGGFFLEQALKKTILMDYTKFKNKRPILLVLSNQLEKSIFTEDLSAYALFLPEEPVFYALDSQNSKLTKYSIQDTDLNSINEGLAGFSGQEVYVYPNKQNPKGYLPVNQQGTMILTSIKQPGKVTVTKEKNWENGLRLQAEWYALQVHPEESQQRWLDLVRNSFITQIMTPVTSYLSLENEAQKQALLAKQQQILSSKKSLDTGEELRQMTEPPLWLLFLCGLLLSVGNLLFFYKRKSRH